MLNSPAYHVIYDGNCNLCVAFTQLLVEFDRGHQFSYTPMQNLDALGEWGITTEDCDLGMILIKNNDPTLRWQGSEAAEEIARLLPIGDVFVEMYRAIPGMKTLGDRLYEQVRNNRYVWFGSRNQTYYVQSPCDDCERGENSGEMTTSATFRRKPSA
jgi:predicted DCC family thiol-disulfide oxidoreductase YuxK